MTLPADARDAWRRHSKLCDFAAERARDAAAALDTYRRHPVPAAADAVTVTRRGYDQAEHEAALVAVAAERLTPDATHDDWELWRRCREAARRALAAPPSAAAEAAADARAAADALEAARAKPWQARAVAKAIASARGAAALAASRADWVEPDADAPPDPRDVLVASAQRALDAAEAALEAAREVVAAVRRSDA